MSGMSSVPSRRWGADCPRPAAPNMGERSSNPRAWAGMARPLWAADVAERAEDTEPQQNRSPHRSEESIFNRPNKLVGMYPLNRLSLRNRCARLARLPNSNGIFLRKINAVSSQTVLGGSPEYLSHLACVSYQARRHSEEFPCIHPLSGIRLSPQIRNTADLTPRRVQSTLRIPYH